MCSANQKIQFGSEIPILFSTINQCYSGDYNWLDKYFFLILSSVKKEWALSSHIFLKKVIPI